jgi:TatD DNase family protein
MKRYINIHTHRQLWNKSSAFSLYDADPEEFFRLQNKEKIYFSVGIHPWHIDKDVEKKLKVLSRIASHRHILAIGETGLDKLSSVDFNLQKEIFIRQIAIAKEVGKPLIVHCVKAWNEILAILKEMQPGVPVIFHGFRSKPLLAVRLIKAGYYLSFGYLFNEKSLQATPLERIFLETDDKDYSIDEIYKSAAEAKEMTEEKLVDIIQANFEVCFSGIF